MATIKAKWTKLAESDRLKRSSHGIAVIGSQLYIFGGEHSSRQPVDNSIDLIELEDNTITVKTLPAPINSPAPRFGTPVTTFRGKLVLFSGRDGISMSPIEENGGLWLYHPDDSYWEFITPKYPNFPFPQGRSYHALSADENIIGLHAGCTDSGRLSDYWAFDLNDRIWREVSAAPGPARGGTSTSMVNLPYKGRQLMYFHPARMNGYDGSDEIGGTLDGYCEADGTWQTIDFKADGVEGPEPRSVGTLLTVAIKGRQHLITMFGEGKPSSLGHAGAGRMFGDAWVFDIEEKKWVKVEWEGEGPCKRGWFAADVVRYESGEDGVVIHGGLGEDNERLGDLWLLGLT